MIAPRRGPTGARTSVRITPRTAKGNEPIWHRGTSRRWSGINSALRENLRAPGSAIRHRVKCSNQALNLCVFSKEPSRSKRVIPVGQTTKPAKQKGTIGGLNNDNTCAGCHSPTRGFGDTQSIAIGVVNNGIVGPDRSGPRNQRRTPISPSEDEFNSLVDFVRQGLLDKRAEPERFRKLVPAQRKNAKLFNV